VDLAVGSKPDRNLDFLVRRGQAEVRKGLRTEKRTRYALGYAGFIGRILTQVRMLKPDSPAEKAGLQAGDLIVSIDGRPVHYFQFTEIVEKSAGKELSLQVKRKGEMIELPVTPRLAGKVGEIGLYLEPESLPVKYGFFAAIAQSVRENVRNTFLIIRFIRDLIAGRASTQQLGGPLEIASFSYAAMQMGFLAMLSFIGLISLQLGIINLFPIPVFDGGQIFVLALEGLFRRDFSPRIRQVWMQIGFVIFVLLIVFIILNDIVKRMPNGWESLIPW
jgi:regulator of sigma E protease